MTSFELRGKWLTWAITVGFLLQGYDQGVMAGIIGADNQFGRDFNHPDPTTQGTIVAIYDIGCALGSIATFIFGESLGRTRTLMTGASIMLIGTAILTSSTTRTQLIVGRIVTGLGNGCNSSSIPVYQSETVSGTVRGALVALDCAITIFGLVIAYWLDYGLSFVNGPAQWRLPIGFQASFALVLLFQAWILPDSPRWLLAHGRESEAVNVLARLADEPEDSYKVLKQRDEIASSIEIESSGGPFRYAELLENGKIGNIRRMILCAGIQIMQHSALPLSYLAPLLFQNTMGLSRQLSLILGGASAVTFLVGSMIPIWTIDRYGRRPILMLSCGGMCFCFAMTAILLSTNTKPAAFGAAAMIFLFQICIGMGFLPNTWLYPAEISTTRIRARGGAVASFAGWVSTFVIVQVTPPAIARISWRVFVIFAIFNALWIPIIYLFFPETKGLELEDIDHIFEKGGITGGVWGAKGGMTVQRGVHSRATAVQGMDIKEEVKGGV
ncbi:general substrate transporter [Gautieria morchelliformis]|nr:general substrate transporter [Gautieria morchelliformis]